MDTSGVIQLIALAILLFLSGFFSSAETSFTTANKVKLKGLADEGSARAVSALKVLDNYSKMLSTILIGNNIVNTAAASLATTLTIKLWGNYAVGFATGLLTILILLFGEISPKNMAMARSEKLALSYAGIILILMKLLTPVIFIVDKLSRIILRICHVDPSRKAVMTENELKTYVDVSHEDGVIESGEKEIIYNVFDFSDTVAKDIMIPRIDMVSVNVDAGYEEVLNIFRDCMYTRLPVYQEDKDNIIGLINIKDFILVRDQAVLNRESFHIRDLMREAYYTYEYKNTADLMMEMREKAVNVSFVLSEYGAAVGMITLEDLLEEIVGEIRDEYDEDEEELIQEVDERTYLVEGGMKLDDINDALDTTLDSEDYDSIGGLIIEYLEDRLPKDGETIVTREGITLQVKGVIQNRIAKVLLTLPESVLQEGNGSEESGSEAQASGKPDTAPSGDDAVSGSIVTAAAPRQRTGEAPSDHG